MVVNEYNSPPPKKIVQNLWNGRIFGVVRMTWHEIANIHIRTYNFTMQCGLPGTQHRFWKGAADLFKNLDKQKKKKKI